jgi:hypothetical protein
MTVGGEDAYPDLWTKAAALLHSVVKNHALVDGNKRLGWMATAVVLELNGGSPTRASNDDAYELVMKVAASDPPLDQIASELRRLTSRRSSRWRASPPPAMNGPGVGGQELRSKRGSPRQWTAVDTLNQSVMY